MKGTLAGSKLAPGELRATILLPAIIAFTGCAQSVAPVSGRVTLDGKPLAGAVVTFQPKADGKSPVSGSAGRTDSDGRFTLRMIEPDRPGAAMGEHTVTISAASGGTDKEPAKGKLLPKTWYDGSKKFNVPPGGTSEANFKIASPPPAGKSKSK